MTSEHFSVPSPRTILEEWSAEDVLDAFILLEWFAKRREDAAKKAAAC